MDIKDIDKNFIIKNNENRNLKFLDAYMLEIEGFNWIGENNKYSRHCPEYENKLTEGLLSLSKMSAGGAVRFKTNSKNICINASYHTILGMQHMSSSGADGFDLYVGTGKDMHLVKNVFPTGNKLDISIEVSGKLEDYTILFPLYAGVDDVKIGFDVDAVVENATEHKIKLPFVFYGSSITQGACASRPGSCYTAIVSREFDAPMVNMGFSGNAKGEDYMAQMISNIPMSAFFYDYDHNAPTAEHLEKTHFNFYEIIRKNNPDIPVIFITGQRAPEFLQYGRKDDILKRIEIIKTSYEKAIENGDKNVYFINGLDLFGDIIPDCCTVDLCHPNDLGFYVMAQKINELIYKFKITF